MFYFELEKMTDRKLLNALKNKIEASDNWQKLHVMVYSILCDRHGDEKAKEIISQI